MVGEQNRAYSAIPGKPFSGYNEWIVDIVVLQVSHTKDVITHKPDKKLMLFSFGNKYDGKKVHILQPNINALYLV